MIPTGGRDRLNRKLLVLGCSETKRNAPGLLPAIERYDGSAYRVIRKFLRSREWPKELSIAILSARYGLMGGFTSIEDYDERMTAQKALEWAPLCETTLNLWASYHSSFYFALGKDYLPAVMPTIKSGLNGKSEVFEGPIGMKLSQIKQLLHSTYSAPRYQAILPEPGLGRIHYFLPDWDDLLDSKYNFKTDTFSGSTRDTRDDKHCSILMKPKRIFDGVLVSLAQHATSKGPLKRLTGTEEISLSPKDLRDSFGLEADQYLFGDCGAFSYVNKDEPPISVEQAVAMYNLYGFDYGASVDHIPMPKIRRNGKVVQLTPVERLSRVEITRRNAEQFIGLAKLRGVGFKPVGIIQALDATGYANMTRLYHEYGYRHIAIGGLVPLPDAAIAEIVTNVMRVASELKPRPWIHLFGVFRPKLQTKFQALKVDSFDSATYFRKSWLRSDQNYLASNGEWYAALRVPMTKDGRTRKKLIQSGLDPAALEVHEAEVMNLLCRYDQDEVGVPEVLDALIAYDRHLVRTSDVGSLRAKYRRTLEDKPWRNCSCPFCTDIGIHTLIFRGANRNKRRGAHNTLMLYRSLKEDS